MLPQGLKVFTLLLLLAFAHPSWSKSDAELGREMYEKITAEMPVYNEGKITAYVNKVGHNIVRASNTPQQTFTFTILDNPGVNAFATPGGYVYINRGLINFFQTEAQLAAVLAHEIAHISEDHAGRQNLAKNTNTVIAGLLGIFTRSGDVAQASAMWGASMVSGYGREMELEADQVGAEYLYRARYDPDAMMQIISLLKDNERFEKRRAKDNRQAMQSYHGLFASHPRNDKRLQEVITRAGTLPANIDHKKNIKQFRIATEGLVWGDNFAPIESKENRFYQPKLRFRFDYPDHWQFTEKTNIITGENRQSTQRMTIRILPRAKESPEQYIKHRLNIPLLKKSQSFKQARMPGHTGFIPGKDGKPDQFFTLLYYNRHAYAFIGETSKEDVTNTQLKDHNRGFADIVKSFRPLSKQALSTTKPKTIHYVKARPGATFKKLANYLKLGKYGEDELRLLNGLYPLGEPNSGQWIKIIR